MGHAFRRAADNHGTVVRYISFRKFGVHILHRNGGNQSGHEIIIIIERDHRFLFQKMGLHTFDKTLIGSTVFHLIGGFQPHQQIRFYPF